MPTPTTRATVLGLAVMFSVASLAAAQTRAATTGRVVGSTHTETKAAIADARVQLRNTASRQIAGVAVSNAKGEFVFDRVRPGAYVIEMVNTSGRVMALGNPFTIAAGETVATYVRVGNSTPVVIPAPIPASVPASVPAAVPASVNDPWDVAVGALAAWRDGTTGPGAGVAVGYRSGRVTPFLEATGIRRDGHNDWRATGGLRLWLKEGAGARLYAHGSVGALIRNSDAGPAFGAGLGAEWSGSERLALRVQGDLTRDRADGVTAGGARASVWVVVR